MHKKELEELYYIFVDNLFELFPIDTKSYNVENPTLPFNTTVTNVEEKCDCFYYYAASFIKLSSKQDNYLYANVPGWSKDKIIKHIKNYIRDEKYAQISCKTLGQYLNNDYTFNAILEECLDISNSIASKVKRGAAQHSPQMTHKQLLYKVSFQQPLTTSDNFVVPYDGITHPQSTSMPSISTWDAIKTDYTVPLVMLVPLFILFCCITSMVMKCCSYIFKKKARDCRMADDDDKLPQSIALSSGSESVQFRSKKTCDENQL
ncbi:MAG: hypothetical protein U0X86_001278 [Wolbachia endosymbiont of Xenopsylla cheopis]